MSTLFEKFSSRDNLKKAYTYVQNELAHSSLSVNPINHPATTAIDDLGEHFFVALEAHIRGGNYKPDRGFFIYMPKDNLGLRPVCALSMVDRIVYQALFNQEILGFKIDGQISDKLCYSNRVNDDLDKERYLNHYFNGWEDFCKEQKKSFKKGYVWKLEVDVQQYYEHIPIERLIKKLKESFSIKDDSLLEILHNQLCVWAEYPELPKGIPQGPDVSAVLGNVYLSSLDTFAEKEFIGKKICYYRYADDITLMGKSKEDVLKATEQIVRFLREDNLTLNEKTKLVELENDTAIEAMRFYSDYGDNTLEIPEDDFTRIQHRAPSIVESILAGESIEKSDIRELKYFLKMDTSYSFELITKLIQIIPLRPSLTVPIVQYVSGGRGFLGFLGDPFDVPLIDSTLWKIYSMTEMSQWSRFWVLKLLVSSSDLTDCGVAEEVEKILTSKQNSIFKFIGFYYKLIQKEKIDFEQLKIAIASCKTDVERSIYSFFLLNAFQEMRVPAVKNHIETLLNSSSHELNLIGAFLFRNKSSVSIDDFEADFSCQLLNKKMTKVKTASHTNNVINEDYFMVRSDNLIPIISPAEVLGVSRPLKKKMTVDIPFPEVVQWEKVLIKIKDGLQDAEIWYDDTHLLTTSYIELGFSANKKDHKPDRKWKFLCLLSYLQNEDIKQATPTNLMPMLSKYSNQTIKVSSVHQTKKQLTKVLRELFKTSADPFAENRIYYEPKFKILPEGVMRNKELWKQGGFLDENVDYET
jgi:hypothetical protein